ncbi:hypothetical protein BJV74DRAFT_769970 [Russula compacta]|nr:hypothetical protein BJV74DRAFT_769970 [Russula compacta]
MHFYDLVAAIKIASGRSITAIQAKEVCNLMLKYLVGLHKLLPMHQLIPHHHISLHVVKLLSHFGLTIVFEWYNHMLQYIETNERFG